MSDCSPLRLVGNGESSPNQSPGGSQNSEPTDQDNNMRSTRCRQQNRQQRQNHQQGQNFDGETNNYHHRRVRSNDSESSSKSGQLRYGARNVIELFVPVSLCMLFVVLSMKMSDSYKYSSQSIIWYAQMMYTDQTVDTGTRVWQSFANALIMLVFIVIMTTILILLYKFRFYATIHGWLILSSLMLLFAFALMYIAEILKVYNQPMDIITVSVFIWNFGVVGMVCIHSKGPLLLQQGYLITISALLALVFIRSLPDWTTWTVLAIVSVWDLVAVLCPRGPLRILVETAQERNEQIFPALIYSSMMVWITGFFMPILSMADSGPNSRPTNDRSSSNSSGKKTGRRHNKQQQSAQSNKSNQGQRASSSRSNSGPATSSPAKRAQHPVEIHYDDGAEPPQVAFIQPSLESVDMPDDLGRPVVRTTHGARTPRDRRPIPSQGAEIVDPERQASATEITINFRPQDSRLEQQAEDERGVKLGLGDFIFYSVLVGKASSYGDWTITISCYLAILVGLCLTLSILAVIRKPLPALPISIAFGICSFFLSYVFVVPLAGTLSINQIFI